MKPEAGMNPAAEGARICIIRKPHRKIASRLRTPLHTTPAHISASGGKSKFRLYPYQFTVQ
jgi:hypothetical protein